MKSPRRKGGGLVSEVYDGGLTVPQCGLEESARFSRDVYLKECGLMKDRHGTVYVSATDLANHLSCRHLTTLDIRLAKREIAAPSWENPHLVVLQQRGLEHERSYIEDLRAMGLSLVDLSNEPEESAVKATQAAMQGGEQAIV